MLLLNPILKMTRKYLILFWFVFSAYHLSAQQQKNFGTNSGKGSLWIGAGAGPSLMIEKAADSLLPELQSYFNQLQAGADFDQLAAQGALKVVFENEKTKIYQPGSFTAGHRLDVPRAE